MAGLKAVWIELSDGERTQLEARLRRRKVARGDAMRAEIVLLAAEGLSNLAITERLGIARMTVATWRRRFAERRLGGLGNEPRPGAPRTAQGMAGSLIRLVRLDWPVPHYSTLSLTQKELTVAISCRRRGEPLHLVVDSTGLKVLGEGEWKVRKHGADQRRVWRKVHLMIDADSHDVRAVEMTDHRHGDSEILPDLLAQLPERERIAVISGDGAYDTRAVYEASTARRAALLVPPRRNGKPWKTQTVGADERNETLGAIKHLGRRLWKRWSGYHRRSLAETAMSRLKRLKRLGERLAARDPARQVAEVQIRCAILNTFNRLGMLDTVALN